MTQPQLPGFGQPAKPDLAPQFHRASIPASCRAAANERAHRNNGLHLLIGTIYKGRRDGITADTVADELERDGRRVVLNTVRRCIFDMAQEGLLLPIGYGTSRYGNPQTLYVHRMYQQIQAEAIRTYRQLEEEKKADREAGE
jgi:hypothetical protein